MRWDRAAAMRRPILRIVSIRSASCRRVQEPVEDRRVRRLRLKLIVERERPTRCPVAAGEVLLQPRVPVAGSERDDDLDGRLRERGRQGKVASC